MMPMHYIADPQSLPRLSTAELRARFLLENLFRADGIELVCTDLDRAVVGGAVPLEEKLVLQPPAELGASYFNERRELGVLNLGGGGAVGVDGERHGMARGDALYIGRGSRRIEFSSDKVAEPARFYLVSYPAQATHPTRHASRADAEPVRLGSAAGANQRTIYKYIHPGGIRSCQLVMGFTQLEEGSVWNTLPPHTHERRTEIYLYFDLAPAQGVLHLMGTPRETRHLFVGNEQAVLSPAWSIHSGVGTARYSFAWAMGGENQEFTDLDPLSVADLR